MKILVTGGLGYIGSIVAKQLRESGFEVVIYDHAIKHSPIESNNQIFIKGDTTDYELLKKTLVENNIQAVLHFAAYIEAGESMQNPGKYFSNNVYGSLQLLRAMADCQVKRLIFSSTAAVYGEPESVPIAETASKKPVNAYGQSKLMVEQMLPWFEKSYGINSIVIRYFNACGALLDGSMGEMHNPETHLIPNILLAVKENRTFMLFGNDYPTADGTCVRDYIHVLDLASAHITALQALINGHKSDIYNAGTGNGYSNKQIVDTVEQVTGKKVQVEYRPRRLGDSAQLIADSGKLKREFNWQTKYSDLQTIISSAWKWHNT